jgi:hypothetical protein
MLKMTSKTEQPDRNIDFEAIDRWHNEGGASGSLKRGAARLRLYYAVDFTLRHRRLQLASRVADTTVSVSHDGREKELVLRASTQAAQDPRQENLAASVSCEMPDAPHLRNNSLPP